MVSQPSLATIRFEMVVHLIWHESQVYNLNFDPGISSFLEKNKFGHQELLLPKYGLLMIHTSILKNGVSEVLNR